MNAETIPEVIAVRGAVALEALPADEVRRRPPPSGWRLLGDGIIAFLGWCWRIPVGALLCLNYFSSILVVGWHYRWMQGRVLRGWWKQSRLRRERSFEEFCASLGAHAPVTRPRWFFQERIASSFHRPAPDGSKPTEVRQTLRALKIPWHSLWLNLKVGLQGLFCTYLITGLGCLMMLFSWEFGWLNSFNKGYEQAWIGPTVGLAGIFLFIAAMFYVPMAQVHQAVTGDYRAFFDFRFVWKLIRARLTPYVLLAGLVALLSLPLEILKTAPAFFDGFGNYWSNASDGELFQKLQVYLFACSVVLFLSLLLSHLVAAVVYRSAVLKVLNRGWVDRSELHPTLAGWLGRLDLIPVPNVDRPGLVWAARWSGRWIYHRFLYTALFVIWFLFIAKVYVGEFLNYHPFFGFMNHVLVQFPCFDFVPQALRQAAGG